MHYYPILVGHEKESWQEAVSAAFDRLRTGIYAAYGAEKEQAFLANLSGK